MDAISFLAFGVFTSAMSGNTIVLGIAIGEQAWPLGINASVALVAYLVGAAISSVVRREPRVLIGAQVVLLTALCGIWLSHEPTLQQPQVRYVLIVLAALAMGVQAAVAQSLRLSGIITVVFTGTLTAIAKAVAERLLGRTTALSTDTKRQMASWVCYCVGAILGGFLQMRTGMAALLPLATSGAALTAACYARSEGGSQST